MYRHILIPTDGSELSKLAVEEGVALAKALNARVTILTVTAPFQPAAVMLTDTPERYKEHMAVSAGQYLDEGKRITAAARERRHAVMTISVDHCHQCQKVSPHF